MQLLAHTLNLFVTDTCVHYVVIEDNATSYGEWLSLLMPHYTRHQLKIVHDYNLSVPDLLRGGYYRQQQIKLQMAEQIYADKYIILDSKIIFFKPLTMSNWPIGHGNNTLGPIGPQYRGWAANVCEMLGIDLPENAILPMTPFVVKTAVARKLLADMDVTDVLWRVPIHAYNDDLYPSEFLLYTLYAMQSNPELISKVHAPPYFFCYYEQDFIDFPPYAIQDKYLVFGMHREMLQTKYLRYLSGYYTWLLSNGVEQKYLDEAWFGPLFKSG
jgi:hypothetical protein